MRPRLVRPMLLFCAALAAPTAALAQAQVSVDIVHTLAAPDPRSPRCLIVASDGNIYGVGGNTLDVFSFQAAQAVFRLTPGGALSLVRTLDGARALSEWQGTIYGLSRQGAFRMALDGSNFQILNVRWRR